LYDIRCAATIQVDSDCMSNWYLHAGTFSVNARRHSGASTLTECQTACEFDPRCVAADWQRIGRECWITTKPNYQHYTSPPRGWQHNDLHYHLVSRCSVITGQCFHEIFNVDNSCMYKIRWVKSSHHRWLTNMCYAAITSVSRFWEQCCGQ